jgi:hypothetical protein
MLDFSKYEMFTYFRMEGVLESCEEGIVYFSGRVTADHGMDGWAKPPSW